MTLDKAKYLAKDYLNSDNIVVSDNGDIFVNCDIDFVCSDLEAQKIDFVIVKGERISKKFKKEIVSNDTEIK